MHCNIRKPNHFRYQNFQPASDRKIGSPAFAVSSERFTLRFLCPPGFAYLILTISMVPIIL